MDTQGYIKPEREITEKEKKSGLWTKLTDEQHEALKRMNRRERRIYAKKHGLFKKGKWGWLQNDLPR